MPYERVIRVSDQTGNGNTTLLSGSQAKRTLDHVLLLQGTLLSFQTGYPSSIHILIFESQHISKTLNSMSLLIATAVDDDLQKNPKYQIWCHLHNSGQQIYLGWGTIQKMYMERIELALYFIKALQTILTNKRRIQAK